MERSDNEIQFSEISSAQEAIEEVSDIRIYFKKNMNLASQDTGGISKHWL